MNVEQLLPIGSVVKLKNSSKELVIMGTMQLKRMKDGTGRAYDYLGVPYPEGYMGQDTGFLFDRDAVEQVVFTGYTSEGRTRFLRAIQQLLDETEKTIQENYTT